VRFTFGEELVVFAILSVVLMIAGRCLNTLAAWMLAGRGPYAVYKTKSRRLAVNLRSASPSAGTKSFRRNGRDASSGPTGPGSRA
jgi:hypothetical protein